MMPIGIRIVINTLSTPLKTRNRITFTPTLSKHPVKVPNNVRTTTMFPTNPLVIPLTLVWVFKGTLLDVVRLNSLAIFSAPLS
jgi:hypothetical protein